MHTQPRWSHLRLLAFLLGTTLGLACQTQPPAGEPLVPADEQESADATAAAADTAADTAVDAVADAPSTLADTAPAQDADPAVDQVAPVDAAAAQDSQVGPDAPVAQDAQPAPDAEVAEDVAAAGDAATVADAAGTADASPADDVAMPDSQASPDAASQDAAGDADSGPVDDGVLKVAGITVQPVDNNPLACRVSWKTNLPASSVVLFGLGGPTMRMNVPEMTNNHQVLVVGMRANQVYSLQVRSAALDGQVVTLPAPSFTTGSLPDYLKPAWPAVQWTDPNEAHFLVLAGIHLNLPGGYNPYDCPPTAVIYDDQGQVVWFHSQQKGSNIVAWWENGAMLVAGGGPALTLDLGGDTLWESSTANGIIETGGPPKPVTGMMHGDIRLLPNGNLLGIEFDVKNNVWGDQLVEREPDGTLVWQWSTFDHLPPGEGDWAHGNSLQPLDNGKTVLYSPRNLNMIFKIDRTTGKFVLRLGEGGDFALQPGSGDDWFALQHAAEELPGNRILLYDNGTMERGYSRAVEYEYDLTSKTAKIVWQYKGDPGPTFFSPGQGSVQRLPNGDTLVSAPDWKAGWAMPSTLRRVSAAGKVRWRLDLPVLFSYPTVAYRAQRVDLPGLEFIPPGEDP